jgi:SAM-dependent methyltransferase
MASAVSSLSAGNGNERFNAEAANWDKNPFVHEASKEAAKAIIKQFPALQDAPGREKLDILEIGCGTGLLSCMLAPHARHYVAVDAAQGMIDVLKTKLGRSDAPQNVVPVAVLLEDPEDHHLPPANEEKPEGKRLKFDLITSHLVLHHIQDLRAVLTTMLGCLKDGGSVALTDFEDTGPESKSFHPKSRMGGVERHGIHADTMEALMNEVGFVNVRVKAVWSMDKMVEKFEGEFGDQPRSRQPDQGVMQRFPFVLCIGERKYCQSSDVS